MLDRKDLLVERSKYIRVEMSISFLGSDYFWRPQALSTNQTKMLKKKKWIWRTEMTTKLKIDFKPPSSHKSWQSAFLYSLLCLAVCFFYRSTVLRPISVSCASYMVTHTNLRSHKLSKGKLLRIQRSSHTQFLLQTLFTQGREKY